MISSLILIIGLSKMEFELAEIKVKVAQIHHSSHNPKTKISQVE